MGLRSRASHTLWLAALCAGFCSVMAQTPAAYGPLSVNLPRGADFYIAQDGAFVPVVIQDGTLVVHLKPAPFQIGTNAAQINLCLSTSQAPEVQADPSGYKDSCLSDAKSGARFPNSDALIVYSGKLWSDGNSSLRESTSKMTTPLPGYQYSYLINELTFVGHHELNLGNAHGTLYGFIGVFKQSKLTPQQIMPLQLVFGG
jgi:hypothetical protein